jgi:hypothetical protein
VLPRALPPRDSVTGRGLYVVSRLSDQVMMAINPLGHGLAIRISKLFEDVAEVFPSDRLHVPNRTKHSPPRLM